MPVPISPSDAQRALQALGVTPQDVEAIRNATSLERATSLLAALKIKAKRQYRKLAIELHPDRTDGDEAKAMLFALVSRAMEELEKTSVQARPQPIVSFVNATSVSVTSTQAGTTTAWVRTRWNGQVPRASNSGGGFSPAQINRLVNLRPA